jgi:hypothetical protein
MLHGFDTHPDPVGIKSKSDGKYDFFRTKIPSGFEELFLGGNMWNPERFMIFSHFQGK